MKKVFAYALLLLVSVMSVPQAFAESGEGKQCSMKHKDCAGKGCDSKDCDKCDKYECAVTGKIMKKAGFFLDNQKEIGLSDDQAAQIKAIKMDTKKGYIRGKAEMEIFELDLKTKLSETKLDVEGLNAMIDQFAAGFSTSTKAGVASYAKLKAVLNEQQMTKAKEIWTAKESK